MGVGGKKYGRRSMKAQGKTMGTVNKTGPGCQELLGTKF